MAQKTTDHCIIGSGLAALGAVMGLRDQGVQDLYLISDSRDDLEHYIPIQILRYLGLGGTSRFWHGVIPTRPDLPLRKHIFKSFFDHDTDMWGTDHLFVPKVPLRSGPLLQKMLSPVQRIAATATHVTLQDGMFKVVLHNGETVLSRQIWCAAGVIGSLGILHRSGFCSDPVIIGDHICGFSGMLTLAQAETMVGRAVNSDRGRDGYSVNMPEKPQI
jgi:hypothetical protein